MWNAADECEEIFSDQFEKLTKTRCKRRFTVNRFDKWHFYASEISMYTENKTILTFKTWTLRNNSLFLCIKLISLCCQGTVDVKNTENSMQICDNSVFSFVNKAFNCHPNTPHQRCSDTILDIVPIPAFFQVSSIYLTYILRVVASWDKLSPFCEAPLHQVNSKNKEKYWSR